MNNIADHPIIHEIETTGYPAGRDKTTLRCPCCGEELSVDDEIYTGYSGEVIGCEHCVEIHYARNMEDELDD